MAEPAKEPVSFAGLTQLQWTCLGQLCNILRSKFPADISHMTFPATAPDS